MAHRPVVGTGMSVATALASAASTSFAIESQYVRLTPVTEGVHVSISQTSLSPTATSSDYYIPAGTSVTGVNLTYWDSIAKDVEAADANAVATDIPVPTTGLCAIIL